MTTTEGDQPDYHEYHARQASRLRPLRGARVMVVGCNTGEDCRYFVEAGAQVLGVDVIAEIGQRYQHARVSYLRNSIETMPLHDGGFDLIYSVATFEHVPNIEAGFREMARLLAPNGFIYCCSSSLWRSRTGSHKADLFEPVAGVWAHLRYNAAELLAISKRTGMPDAEHHVGYIFDGRYFNHRPSQDYLKATAALPGLSIVINRLDLDPAPADATAMAELVGKGYSTQDLLATTHLFIARRGRVGWLWRRLWWSRRARASALRRLGLT